jgi:hypothetical protein
MFLRPLSTTHPEAIDIAFHHDAGLITTVYSGRKFLYRRNYQSQREAQFIT